MSLKEQLAEYRAGWFKRVPAERQAIMERHIAELRNGLRKTALKTGTGRRRSCSSMRRVKLSMSPRCSSADPSS